MTASRKSAELLARFIYLASHSQQMEELTFAEILRDVTVKRFVHNWDVMDAFHYIRKSGNKAVHGDDDELPEDAIDVLHDLHFVAGETACMLVDLQPDKYLNRLKKSMGLNAAKDSSLMLQIKFCRK